MSSPKIQAAIKNFNQRQAELIELRAMVKGLSEGVTGQKDWQAVFSSLIGSEYTLPPPESKEDKKPKDDKKALPVGIVEKTVVGHVKAQEPKFRVGQRVEFHLDGKTDTDIGKITNRAEDSQGWVYNIDSPGLSSTIREESILDKSLKGAKTKADPTISWTPEKLKKFKVAYEAADGDTFTFEGHEFVKGYAKYLIEYLEGQFGGKSLTGKQKAMVSAEDIKNNQTVIVDGQEKTTKTVWGSGPGKVTLEFTDGTEQEVKWGTKFEVKYLKTLKTKIKSLAVQDELQTGRELKQLKAMVKALSYTSGRPRVHTYGTEDEIHAAIREYETFARANPNDPLGRDLLETVADLRDELKMRQEVRNLDRKAMPVGTKGGPGSGPRPGKGKDEFGERDSDYDDEGYRQSDPMEDEDDRKRKREKKKKAMPVGIVETTTIGVVNKKAMDVKAEYQKLRSSGFRHEDAARYLDREFGVSREELEYTLDPVNFKPKVDPRGEDPQPNQMLY